MPGRSACKREKPANRPDTGAGCRTRRWRCAEATKADRRARAPSTHRHAYTQQEHRQVGCGQHVPRGVPLRAALVDENALNGILLCERGAVGDGLLDEAARHPANAVVATGAPCAVSGRGRGSAAAPPRRPQQRAGHGAGGSVSAYLGATTLAEPTVLTLGAETGLLPRWFNNTAAQAESHGGRGPWLHR